MTIPGSHAEHTLQEIYGTSKKAAAFYKKQMLNYLNPSMCEFITQQEMVFIASSDAKGECDCSFRAGLPGFIHVIENNLLAYPEYRGNSVLASLGNISENPHIGMVFIDFFRSTVGLHINGTARIVENDDLCRQETLPDAMKQTIHLPDRQKPERWVFIHVEEAYIHSSKHIPLLKKLDREIHWGTDDDLYKGGDYFKAKSCARPWLSIPEEVTDDEKNDNKSNAA
ncbi:MAG: pyridoxamine 5'-phosphate oxidase family protein [Gammaproteobacteria bacterium]